MNKAGGYTILGAITFLASAGVMSWGQPETPRLRFYWGAPMGGSAVHHYVGEQMFVTQAGDTVFVPHADIPDTTLFVDYQWGVMTQLRVAGVDSVGRQGPWSIWSEPWADDGPPAAPLVVERTLVLE